MRGGVQVWKRGVDGHGLRHATAYALQGGCDAAEVARQVSAGADAAVEYGPEDAPSVLRWTVTEDGLTADRLDRDRLRAWIDGADPMTGEQRGRMLTSPDAHLLYDSTVNAPKSYSLAAVLHPELREEFDALMDRVTTETVTAWREELTTRRGAGGKQRIGVTQIEVVQLDHERSRSLDPHAHRHLWLNAKVQGADGRWSGVDSQQVFRHQVLVNARGELAARTDARWRAALAAHGYTLNADGEIAELAHVVEPMSKRAQQITRNKERYEAEWRAAHPGREPSPRLIEAWDRRAWAQGRAQKPGELDEAAWRDQVRREIADVDPAVLVDRGPVQIPPADLATLDRDHLTQAALGWADHRSVRSQGRFSIVDLRAAATMALAQAQVIAAPADQAQLIEEIETRALAHVETLAPANREVPDDVKTLRLRDVGATRARITERAAVRAALADPTPASPKRIAAAMRTVDAERVAAGRDKVPLDAEKIAAARAVAGSCPLVVIEGPAGSGKTTMLTVAERAVTAEGRRMLTVAPTMKAAQVASSEIGGEGSSLHALLFQHGYRWRTEENGATRWHRLSAGDVDQDGTIYQGPADAARLDARDVLVCDEAGMVDLDAMAALLTVADETGAHLTLIGDPHQIRPVGHSGAMALVQQQTPDAARLTLDAIFRFRRADDPRETDHVYAEITRDMRRAGTPEMAREVAQWLTEHEHIAPCSSEEDQVAQMSAAWLTAHGAGESIALMADDNATVAAVNTAVQEARIEAGQLPTERAALGRDRQALYLGDVISTRRNHRGEDFTVANRELWKVTDVLDDGGLVVTGGTDQRSETIPAEYVRESVTLGYASTVHGAQGVTANAAMIAVSEDTNAAQLYVGMTRGRVQNIALVVAPSSDVAREKVGDAIMRERHDLTDEELRALVAGDVERAGVTGKPAAPAASWRGRKFGDLVDPEPLYDRLSRQRTRLAATVREHEGTYARLSRRLATEAEPAVPVARRDGAEVREVQLRQRQRDALAKRVKENKEKRDAAAEELGIIEGHMRDLSAEIRHRLGMDPETARAEHDDREAAAIHQPASPDDAIRRPYGLALDLRAERAKLAAQRARLAREREEAIAQEGPVAARAAEAREEAAAARDLLARTTADHRAEHDRLAGATRAAISADLASLRAAQDAAGNAGLLRRGAARRAAEDAALTFRDRWGTLPEHEDAASWIGATAAAAAERDLSRTPAGDRLTAAQRAHDAASSALDVATRSEDTARARVTDTSAALRDVDARTADVDREAAIRREMRDEPADRERRLRHARAAATGRRPEPAAARPSAPARPSIEQDDARRRGPRLS